MSTSLDLLITLWETREFYTDSSTRDIGILLTHMCVTLLMYNSVKETLIFIY